MPTEEAQIAAADVFGGAEDTNLHDLRTLALSRHVGISIETDDEERADRLIAAVAKALRLPLVEWTITKGMVRREKMLQIGGTKEPSDALQAVSSFEGSGIFVFKDFAKKLADPEISRTFRDLLKRLAGPSSLSTVILVGSNVELPDEVRPHVTSFDIKLPNSGEYARTIQGVVDSLATNRHATVEISLGDYPRFADALRGLTLNQARRAVAQVAIADGRLAIDDLSNLVQLKASILENGGLLEYFATSENDVEIGGFAALRTWLDRRKQAFGETARDFNLPAPKGVLLVGVQGCGKSLAAKAIARDWQIPLLRLDSGRLYDKFVGESERNFRHAVSVAESLSPVVLWIDEIEKGMAQGGGGEADGGLSRRIFGAFLTWLQEKHENVFVVATANDIGSLPPELIRKGRFDEVFFVDLPDATERAEIFRIHLSFRKQDPSRFDLAALAGASEGFSGAEIEQVVVTTMLGALQTRIAPTTETVLASIGETVPLSVSRAAEIEDLRERAKSQFVPVN